MFLSLNEKKKYQRSITKMVQWAATKNYDVYFSGHYKDSMSEWERRINVNSNQREDNQLFAIAHECGHLLIRKCSNDFSKKYPCLFKCSIKRKNKKVEKSKKYLIELIKEEVEAWERGKALLKRLNVFFNEKKYDECSTVCLYTYVEGAVDDYRS